MSLSSRQLHSRSKTKLSGNGKRNILSRKKHRSEMGNYFSATKFAESDALVDVRRRGGRVTKRLHTASVVNLLTASGYKKAKIKSVLESPDNRNFARQAMITKGTIIETDMGKAVVLNRPGRDGTINAKLLGS